MVLKLSSILLGACLFFPAASYADSSTVNKLDESADKVKKAMGQGAPKAQPSKPTTGVSGGSKSRK